MAALDVAADNLEATVGGITADGERPAPAIACDVTSESSVDDTVDALATDLGPPTVVCNVAGIGGFFNTVDMPLERWEKILAVNLTGPFLVCRATLPHLLEHGRLHRQRGLQHRPRWVSRTRRRTAPPRPGS